MPALAFGSNIFSQCVPSSSDLEILSPVELPDVERVEHCSWSQTLVLNKTSGSDKPQYEIQGLPFEGDLRPELLVGQDQFVVLPPDPEERSIPRLCCMNGHGELLRVLDDPASSIQFFESFATMASGPTSTFVLPAPHSPIVKVVGGASHFLILTATSLYSFGDNRFSQCGLPSSQSTVSEPTLVDFFEGIHPTDIAAGDLHSAVITKDGSLYLFGSDKDGQCGGLGSEPELVDLRDKEDEEEPEVLAVGCGSSHTVVGTTQGLWVAGANQSGQLGLGDTTSRSTFVSVPTLESTTAKQIHCSRWTTYLNT